MGQKPFEKKYLDNQLQVIQSVPFILLMDWELMKILYQPFFLVMKAKRKNEEEHYLESHWKKVMGGDIRSATSTFQEQEVHFSDETLDINMEELNESMEVIHEPIKITPEDNTYCLSNNSTPCYACQGKSNLVKALISKINKLTLENKQLKHRSIMKTSTFTLRKIKAYAKMKFYTEINNIVIFNKIFRHIQPFLSGIIS